SDDRDYRSVRGPAQVGALAIRDFALGQAQLTGTTVTPPRLAVREPVRDHCVARTACGQSGVFGGRRRMRPLRLILGSWLSVLAFVVLLVPGVSASAEMPYAGDASIRV